MWNPPTYYQQKTTWATHEDKALQAVWGHAPIEEICEAFMCEPFCVVSRARQLGLVQANYQYMTAHRIEWLVRMYEQEIPDDFIAECFGLPDSVSVYYSPPADCVHVSQRAIQDYHAKRNKNQPDMFNNTEDKDTTR